MNIMNSRRHLLSCAVLSCLFLGATAFAQGRPITHDGGISTSRGLGGGGQVRPNPEPFSLALLGLGGAGLVYSVKRRRRQGKATEA